VEAYGESIPDPGDESTYQRCKLDFAERELNRQTCAMFVDLLQLRRQEPAFCAPRPGGVDGAVLSPAAFVLRFFTPSFANDRLLIVNLGPELNRPSYAEPLLASPAGTDWTMQWSSDEPRYGGWGSREPWTKGPWRIPPECALVLAPGPQWLPRESKKRRRSA
jgi:maltooligosyltrehalose trehalohydrolase